MTLTRTRSIVLIVVAALLAWAYVAFDRWQRDMIFMPSRDMKSTPQSVALVFSDQWIEAPRAGGVEQGKVHGWWLPGATPAAAAVLYLHGNSDTISSKLDAIARLHAAGFAVLAIDYRGFGKSADVLPEERSAYADAQAAWERMAQLAPQAGKRLVYGHSLGGAIAVELASKVQGLDGLVVEGSFTSVVDVAKTTSFDWMPLSLVVTQRFASDEKVGALAVPKLFIHCAKDEVVPLQFGSRLYQMAAQPKTQLIIPGGKHNTCAATGEDAWLQAMRQIGGMRHPLS